MELVDLLKQKREKIVERWFDTVAENYPSNTSEHLKNQKDQFQNPVGHTMRESLPVFFSALLGEIDQPTLTGAIENIVRIRTVQSLVPSQAVSFVFLLKNIIRQQLSDELADRKANEQLREFESLIDGLALQVFDQYLKCKEKLFEIRAQETKMRSIKLVEQVNKIYGGLDDQS